MTRKAVIKKPHPMDEVAARIDAHLKRFEADPVINLPVKYGTAQDGLPPYWKANARRVHARVYVTYVGYQPASSLTPDGAQTYLTWLDAGNIGRHWGALKGLRSRPPSTPTPATET